MRISNVMQRPCSAPTASDSHGFVDRPLELLQHVDIFLMTSALEGIPRSLMEAMAMAKPVVAFDIPGVDQLVTHGETGLLAPFGDVDALAAHCTRLLHEPALARQLADNGRAYVLERFSAHRMAQEYTSLYRHLVGGESSDPSAAAGEPDATIDRAA